MTQEQIEAVMQIVHSLRTGAMFQDHRDAAEAVVREAITTLQARVDEAEARLEASQEALADQLEARSKLEAEVARITKERDACAKMVDLNDQARADLATLRAAVDEAVLAAQEMADKLWVLRCNSRDDLDRAAAEAAGAMWSAAYATLRNLTKPEAHGLRSDGEVCSSAWVKGAPCDCNLTKPDTPSERIMSDKDRENPVEGAHPTQPEGEDALVEALNDALGRLCDYDEWDAYDLHKALASRGLVRGEGVER